MTFLYQVDNPGSSSSWSRISCKGKKTLGLIFLGFSVQFEKLGKPLNSKINQEKIESISGSKENSIWNDLTWITIT